MDRYVKSCNMTNYYDGVVVISQKLNLPWSMLSIVRISWKMLRNTDSGNPLTTSFMMGHVITAMVMIMVMTTTQHV